MAKHMFRERRLVPAARRSQGRIIAAAGRRRRAGATLVVVTLALVCLMGAAATTIDVGHMFMLMGQAQALADACALAAASGDIVDHSAGVQERVQSLLAANARFPVPASSGPGDVTAYGSGASVPSYGPIGEDEEAVTVRVRMTGQFGFGRVLGLTSRVIERQATALRGAAAGADTVMFAMSPDAGARGIDLSGARGLFQGALHSNSGIDISGNGHQFRGPVEWATDLRVTGSGHTFEMGDVRAPVREPPVKYQEPDFGPFDHYIEGDFDVSGSQTVPPGVYRVYGNVHVSGSGSRLEGVTFVADGCIQFSGSNHYYSPARLGVFAYSLSGDRNGAIMISGAAPDCRGTLYAPSGHVSYAGANASFTSIIAWTIDVTGSDFHIRPSLKGVKGEKRVKLIG